ncbi:hypothetical protein BJI67_05455 [Acidihalobacter aeolianus]|uniref:STAS domain-containing protein n=1 Tax=Acidihalobacter aeolianus TaxID=2792603 RepID=A0A1D8K6J1_9GAMM|nr:STAS domain-containing protein [Acidihalobacter aeolianus]AOV16589.1 hypothetical protein BJI67_05455 [Acidihalobacter aeolianus]
MDIVAERQGDRMQLSLMGDLDIYGVADIHAHLASALDEAATVSLDLSRVENVDAAGIQLLMAVKREAGHRDKTFALIHHSACVIEAIELCQLERFFGDPLVLRPAAGRRT